MPPYMVENTTRDLDLVPALRPSIVGEEDLPDEVSAAADGSLLENALQVLLHGVRRDAEVCGDLGGEMASEDQPGHVLLALCQPVRGHEQGEMRAGSAGSTMTATRRAPSATSDAP